MRQRWLQTMLAAAVDRLDAGFFIEKMPKLVSFERTFKVARQSLSRFVCDWTGQGGDVILVEQLSNPALGDLWAVVWMIWQGWA